MGVKVVMKVSNEGEAKHLILSILPERGIRQKCLMMFADAIVEANTYGRDKWIVNYATNKIRLHVGHLIICTLQNGRAWIALDKGLLETSSYQSLLEQSGDWKWGDGRYAEYRQIPSRNGYYLPSEEHAEIWPGIRRLHFESIYRAANETTMDPRTPKTHSSEILKYLRNELGRHVPDPLHK